MCNPYEKRSNMSPKIRILVKYEQPSENMAKKLLKIYCDLKIKIIHIETIKDGFILFIGDLKEAEKIFEEKNVKAATFAKFQPVLPKEIVCQRNLFVKVNKFVLSQTTDAIMRELKSQNIDLSILGVSKIGDSNYIKISVDHSNTAKKILDQGIGMFNLHTPGYDISLQRYVEIIKCYNCFLYNDHDTRSCKKPRIIKCTNCLGPHSYKNCNISRNEFTCFHCQGNHHSFAFTCKVRKQLVQDLKRKDSEPKTYANVARNNDLFERRSSAMYSNTSRPSLLPLPTPHTAPLSVRNVPPSNLPFDTSVPPPPLPPPPFPLHPSTANLMIEVMSKTTAVIQFALNNESKEPNTFMKTYQELCQSNNLPILNLGNLNLGNLEPSDLEQPVVMAARSINEELNDTSFLSANGENPDVTRTPVTKVPINSSPIITSDKEESTQILCASPASPIGKNVIILPEGATESQQSPQIIRSMSITPTCSKKPVGTRLCQTIPLSHSCLHPLTDTSSSDASSTDTSSTDASSTDASSTDASPTDASPAAPQLSSAFPTEAPLSLQMPIIESPPSSDASPSTQMPPIESPLPSDAPLSPQMPPIGFPLPVEGVASLPAEASISPLMPPLVAPNTLNSLDNISRSNLDNSDKLRLYTIKHTRIATMDLLITARDIGKIAIECDGKIVKDKKTVDFYIRNRFNCLKDSRHNVNNDELIKMLNS